MFKEPKPELATETKFNKLMHLLHELAPEFERKVLEITSGSHGMVNCHGTSLYLAGVLKYPTPIDNSEMENEDGYLSGMKRNNSLVPGSLVLARAFGKNIIHSGILLKPNDKELLILHKNGKGPIEISKLQDVFTTKLENIESWSLK
jgi:hypothetical protein